VPPGRPRLADAGAGRRGRQCALRADADARLAAGTVACGGGRGVQALNGGPKPRGATAEPAAEPHRSIWVERLTLTNFRNYSAARLDLTPDPVVLLGANGAGKTNLLEAVSLLAPGQGLRRVPFPQLARIGGSGDWAVAGRVHAPRGTVDIGTGASPARTPMPERERAAWF